MTTQKFCEENPGDAACHIEKLEQQLAFLKSKIEYSKIDGMAWATMNWCVEVWSLAPATLDGAIADSLANARSEPPRSNT